MTTPARSAAAALGLFVVLALAACGGSEPPPSGTSSVPASGTTAVTSATTSATGTGTGTASQLTGIPVYWVAESREAFRLYREFRTVPEAGGPIASAVAAMTRMTPLDPDYMTPWKPASRVSVQQSGTSLAVDLSADAISGTQVGSELAATAVQQLVYTATAAASVAGTPATTVTITVDGQPAEAWGVVRLGAPTERAPMASIQAHAWVTSPQEGAVLKAGANTFKGFGTSFEATFLWKITTAAGAVVKEGNAMGGTGTGGFGEFTFTANLNPGSYVVEVRTDDPSGGAEGPGAAFDNKSFTVK